MDTGPFAHLVPETVDPLVADGLCDDVDGKAEQLAREHAEQIVRADVGDQDQDAAAFGEDALHVGTDGRVETDARGEFAALFPGKAEEFEDVEDLVAHHRAVGFPAVALAPFREGAAEGVEDDAAAEADDSAKDEGPAAGDAVEPREGAERGVPGETAEEEIHRPERTAIRRAKAKPFRRAGFNFCQCLAKGRPARFFREERHPDVHPTRKGQRPRTCRKMADIETHENLFADIEKGSKMARFP